MQRMYGFGLDAASARYSFVEGLNSRLDEIQAAFLRVKLAHLPGELESRRRIAARLNAGIEQIIASSDGSMRLVRTTDATDIAPHLFVVQVPERKRLMELFQDNAIGFGVHYPVPVHLMDGYRATIRVSGNGPGLPVTEAAAGHILSLAFHPALQDQAIDRIHSALSSFARR
jgi:dTDP-4-amino-4,6-dideoxygalactose transaminase